MRTPYTEPYTARERLTIQVDLRRYDWHAFWDSGLWQWLAHLLPRRLALFAFIRVMGHAWAEAKTIEPGGHHLQRGVQALGRDDDAVSKPGRRPRLSLPEGPIFIGIKRCGGRGGLGRRLTIWAPGAPGDEHRHGSTTEQLGQPYSVTAGGAARSHQTAGWVRGRGHRARHTRRRSGYGSMDSR